MSKENTWNLPKGNTQDLPGKDMKYLLKDGERNLRKDGKRKLSEGDAKGEMGDQIQKLLNEKTPKQLKNPESS